MCISLVSRHAAGGGYVCPGVRLIADSRVDRGLGHPSPSHDPCLLSTRRMFMHALLSTADRAAHHRVQQPRPRTRLESAPVAAVLASAAARAAGAGGGHRLGLRPPRRCRRRILVANAHSRALRGLRSAWQLAAEHRCFGHVVHSCALFTQSQHCLPAWLACAWMLYTCAATRGSGGALLPCTARTLQGFRRA